ncbi:DUF2497 domain-containing protein [Swingsia samuiensis]|uniref:DUF2497 domain-containing protein n=1 Tax=Swingsia samuiensis TaxID=1293412 RepID=A0A4Y6UMA2_9PROT|nr:DUF2497 domain-containing protein [Swingsia samuiensis]QDH17910.1 DUF2497 domain-containing protein [Swingsia samuiensis]
MSDPKTPIENKVSNDEHFGDFLHSIRRALNNDETLPSQAATNHMNETDMNNSEDFFLEPSMMVSKPDSVPNIEASKEEKKNIHLMDSLTQAAAEQSLNALHSAFNARTLAPDTIVSNNNSMTIEEMVRTEIRGMVRTWLDAHLPSLVEILVRAEIARLRPKD